MGEEKRGRSIMLIHMLAVRFLNIYIVFIAQALGQSISGRQLNPNLIPVSAGRTLSVGHY